MQLAIILTESETSILQEEQETSSARLSLREKIKKLSDSLNQESIPIMGNDDGELFDLCLSSEDI